MAFLLKHTVRVEYDTFTVIQWQALGGNSLMRCVVVR